MVSYKALNTAIESVVTDVFYVLGYGDRRECGATIKHAYAHVVQTVWQLYGLKTRAFTECVVPYFLRGVWDVYRREVRTAREKSRLYFRDANRQFHGFETAASEEGSQADFLYALGNVD